MSERMGGIRKVRREEEGFKGREEGKVEAYRTCVDWFGVLRYPDHDLTSCRVALVRE